MKRHAVAPLKGQAAEEKKVVALVDDVGPKTAIGTQQSPNAGNVIGKLQQLANGCRAKPPQNGKTPILTAEIVAVIGAGSDHQDLMALVAKSSHKRLEVDCLTVTRQDAMAVKDAH